MVFHLPEDLASESEAKCGGQEKEFTKFYQKIYKNITCNINPIFLYMQK